MKLNEVMRLVVVIIISCAFLLVSCAKKTHTLSTMTPDINLSDRINVTYFNIMAGKSNDQLRVITSPDSILKIANLANKKLFNQSGVASLWCSEMIVQDRSNVLTLSFYRKNEYLGSIGIGPIKDSNYFLNYYYYGKTSVSCVSDTEKREFLSLIGISEEMFQQILAGKLANAQ